MASLFTHLAAALEAVSNARNEYGNAVRLHSRYSKILRAMRDFHSFWTMERGGRWHAIDAEARAVQSVETTDFDWVCSQLGNSLVGMMYQALIQANNNNRPAFVKLDTKINKKLCALISMKTRNNNAYERLRNAWLAFRKEELKRLK